MPASCSAVASRATTTWRVPTARGLHEAGYDQTPVSAEFAGFIGTGQMSRNARFTLEWGDGSGPTSVVVKVPSSDPNVRAGSFDSSTYLNECEFYRSVAPLVDVAVPGVLAVHYDADARDFAIVLEDLAGSEQGDQFSEPTDAQLTLAAHAVVAEIIRSAFRRGV